MYAIVQSDKTLKLCVAFVLKATQMHRLKNEWINVWICGSCSSHNWSISSRISLRQNVRVLRDRCYTYSILVIRAIRLVCLIRLDDLTIYCYSYKCTRGSFFDWHENTAQHSTYYHIDGFKYGPIVIDDNVVSILTSFICWSIAELRFNFYSIVSL